MRDNLYKARSAIFGHAVGDALGVPVEFTSRNKRNAVPVTQMLGYGTYPYPAGTWSDDTSMTIATLDSLINGINYDDIMKKFCMWFENAEYTASGVVFDIGVAVKKSLLNYMIRGILPLECGQRSEWDNGNGSLMRIIPIILYLAFSHKKEMIISEKINCIEKVSALTHGHPRSFVGCGIYAFVLFELLNKQDKNSILRGMKKAKEFYKEHSEYEYYADIFENDLETLSSDKVCGNGYVVNCLKAALWCVMVTESYEECVLKAVNLGEDTDTTAAVAGGLAGVLYGYESIPKEWIATLERNEYIDELCERAVKAWK